MQPTSYVHTEQVRAALRGERLLPPNLYRTNEPTKFRYQDLSLKGSQQWHDIQLHPDESVTVWWDGDSERYCDVFRWLRDGFDWFPGVNENTANFFDICGALVREQMDLYPALCT
jgi:hypothetical protein